MPPKPGTGLRLHAAGGETAKTVDIREGVALVTGGAHRVGRAVTLELARAGANVVVLFNASTGPAEETAQDARALGVDAMTVQCDVSDLGAVQRMAKAVRSRFGRLDLLVNAADRFDAHTVPTEDYDTWRRAIDVSVHGSFYVSNELAPLLLERPQAAIVNIVDISVWHAWPNFTAHAVAKSGLLALTRQLALELAPTVLVNAVAPGHVMPQPHYNEEFLRRSADRTLLKRWGTPEDVARAVRFLAQSDYITGEVIRVDGGELIALRSE